MVKGDGTSESESEDTSKLKKNNMRHIVGMVLAVFLGDDGMKLTEGKGRNEKTQGR